VIPLVTDVTEDGTTKEWNGMPLTESVPNLLILIDQVVVTLVHAKNLHATETLSPFLELPKFGLSFLLLKTLTTNTQYQSVLMLQTGHLIQEVSSPIAEDLSITVYSLLDIVVTLIG